MRRYILFCIAMALYFADLAVAIAGDHGKWELEQRRSFIFTLSYKQSVSISNQTATSEFAFLCDLGNRVRFVGAILIPFDGTFESRQDPTPVLIQKKSDEFDQSDLSQKWKNGSDFLFLDVTDDLADLIALLKEKDAEPDKSVHFHFPNGVDMAQQTSNHIVVDASGFAAKFAEFEKDCTSPQ
jgi:hypothetical protein